MKLNKLQKKYIQKSRLFLYPLLEIKRGVKFIPVQTFVSWENVYKVEDQKLILVYEPDDSEDFYKFEEKYLLKNEYFSEYYELENQNITYIFDLSSSKTKSDCFNYFIKGQYSKMPPVFKNLILQFFSDISSHQLRMKSYLNPEDYITNYAELLDVSESLLESVGELCNSPNLKKEHLKISKKIITLANK